MQYIVNEIIVKKNFKKLCKICWQKNLIMILCIGCPVNGRQNDRVSIVYRTLTTAYKRKDTDNIKRVKSSKDMYLKNTYYNERKFEKENVL